MKNYKVTVPFDTETHSDLKTISRSLRITLPELVSELVEIALEIKAVHLRKEVGFARQGYKRGRSHLFI